MLISNFNGNITSKNCCCCSVAKSCPTLCDPMNCSTPGFPVFHYLLEFAQTHAHWVSDTIQPSRPRWPPSLPAFNLFQTSHCVCMLSCSVMSNSFATPQTVALQAPLSMGFSRQEYWSGLPFPSPGNLPDPGIKPTSPALQVGSLPLSHPGSPKTFH